MLRCLGLVSIGIAASLVGGGEILAVIKKIEEDLQKNTSSLPLKTKSSDGVEEVQNIAKLPILEDSQAAAMLFNLSQVASEGFQVPNNIACIEAAPLPKIRKMRRRE